MYVPIGSRLTYVSEYDNDFLTRLTLSPGDFLSKVSSDLANASNILVEDSANNLSVFNSKVSYTLKVLTKDNDHASENDVKSIIDHYMYIEGSEWPPSSRITDVTLPNAASVSTGAPPAPPDTPDAANTDSGSTSSSSGGWFDNIFSTSGIGTLGLGISAGSIGLILGVGLVIGLIFIVTAKEI